MIDLQQFLPPAASPHGAAIDSLVVALVWITGAILLIFLLAFAHILFHFRERREPAKLGASGTLQILSVLVPAMLLIVVVFLIDRTWTAEASESAGAHPAPILVIARRFNWNAIYAGPDGKIGDYLHFPQLTDADWPRDSQGQLVQFWKTAGPGSLPRDQAVRLISLYTREGGGTSPKGPNEFGKVFDPAADPAGTDDIYNNPVGRFEIPVNRPTVFEVASMDVIHNFYLPNFNVNVFAVPGATTYVTITPTITSKERQRDVVYDLDDLAQLLRNPDYAELQIRIAADSPGHPEHGPFGWRYVDNRKMTILHDGQQFPSDPADDIGRLKSIGVTRISAHLPAYWEIVCAQLCGNLHTTMSGKIFVLDEQEWSKKYESKSAGAPSTPLRTGR